jgi:hypothetical protein
MMIDHFPVDSEEHWMPIRSIGSPEWKPIYIFTTENFQEISSRIADPIAGSVRPLVAELPVPFDPPPKVDGCNTETGVRLGIPKILVPTNCNQSVLAQLPRASIDPGGYWERVAINEHEPIIVSVSRGACHFRKSVQLLCVRGGAGRRSIKESMLEVSFCNTVDESVNPIGTLSVSGDIVQLRFYPAFSLPVNGQDVDHVIFTEKYFCRPSARRRLGSLRHELNEVWGACLPFAGLAQELGGELVGATANSEVGKE